jgi:signal transduction histidine kinase
LGEAINCVYADTAPGGCGTTEYCSSCGAAIAMVTALGTNKPVERTCAVTVDRNGKKADLFFRVRSFPITLDGTPFLLVFLQDHTQPQQWAALERAFFHDISNVLGALLPVSEIVTENHRDDPAAQHLERLVLRLIQEVSVQRALLRAGIGGYQPVYFRVSTSEILDELMSTFSRHELAATRPLIRPDEVPEAYLKTDFALIVRILDNMVINALEATDEGGQIKLGVDASNGSVAFTVWNRGAIPEDIARRVFQRNFSTKPGTGRGLGTYFMKVFGEQVLGGEVDFVTSEEAGTTFRIRVSQNP